MVVASSLQFPYGFRLYSSYGLPSYPKIKDAWNLQILSRGTNKKICPSSKRRAFFCRSILLPSGASSCLMQNAPAVLKRVCDSLSSKSLVYQLIPAIGVITLAWGLMPLMHLGWTVFIHNNGGAGNWKRSSTYFFATSYVQPLLLWTGALLICRALDPIVLPTEASQAVKQRLLHFVRSFSTVVAFAYCVS